MNNFIEILIAINFTTMTLVVSISALLFIIWLIKELKH